MDAHQFKEEDNESAGELSTVCSQTAVKCRYLARIGRPDILWSVSKLARAVTKWTILWQTLGAFGSRTFIKVFFKTPILQEKWKTQNQHQEEFCAISEVTRLCQKVGCARNRLQFHTALQKLESILLMQVYAWTLFPSFTGIWWLKHVIPHRADQMDPRESHGQTSWQLSSPTCTTPSLSITPTSLQQNINHNPSKKMHFGPNAMLYVFEDNEAVIRTIIPKVEVTQWDMFHGPTKELCIGCFTSIRYLDIKHQLADMLIERNFTRDEWNNLLHLFNISHFSSTRCTKNFNLISCITMAKKIQNQKEEERVVSKSRPAPMNLFFHDNKFLHRIESDCI